MASSLLVIISITIAIGIYFLDSFLNIPHDPREPALISPRVPWVGHVINLLRYGTEYYSQIAKKCNKPIFTLNLPRAKMYVITSPSLVAACDRCARTISFSPYVVAFAERIMNASQASIDLLSVDLLEDGGRENLRLETTKAMHESLKGSDLNGMMQGLLREMLHFLDSEDSINDRGGAPLFNSIRRFMSIVSTQALYGRDNPMQYLETIDDFWMVDKYFGPLAVNLVPKLIVPRASRARERFFNALDRFYSCGGLEDASRFIKARYVVNKKYCVENKDIAHFDLGVCTALLVNTVPAVSWMLFYAFSNKTILARLRQEIEACITIGDSTHERSTTSINIPQVIKAVPLLESFVKEVLRVQSHGSSARLVLEDTFINDTDGKTYFLKKNSFLTMPSALVHGSEAGWGPHAKEFNASRFLESQDNVKVTASSYRVFGGGRAICPGRHLAMNMMMSLLVVMILRYDIQPLEGDWMKPMLKNHISTSFLMPVKDVWVHIQPREQRNKWDFVWDIKRLSQGIEQEDS
ncbi:cytochrome P450 [Biscogniauxia mediterranea]|nr:cytochrome P450 [Biscogniauxia mediterranea]